MNSTEQTTNVAQNILLHLGGARFLSMTGATGLVSDSHSLSMKLRASMTTTHVNFCRVELDVLSDTYRVTVAYAKGFQMSHTQEREGVQAAELQNVFTQLTGMFTTLR